MSKVVIIAWREFRQTVFRKVFLLAIVGIPVMIVGALVLLISVIQSHEKPSLEEVFVQLVGQDEGAEAAAQAREDLTRV